jgi:hypothetical protein
MFVIAIVEEVEVEELVAAVVEELVGGGEIALELEVVAVVLLDGEVATLVVVVVVGVVVFEVAMLEELELAELLLPLLEEAPVPGVS